jgi:hypothetical protein
VDEMVRSDLEEARQHTAGKARPDLEASRLIA